MKQISIIYSLIVFLFISSCASTEEKSQVETTKKATPVEVTSVAAAPVLAKEPVAVQTEVATSPSSEAKESHHTPPGVTPEQAMKWLKHGNRRFTKGFFRNDGATPKDVARLSTEQKPHSIVLSCSDSRVPPEVIFDQKLGEIFVVRTAGEVLDYSAIASIEYAVEHLGSRNILVMGHSQCGAVKAALATMEGQDAGSANLNKLVGDIHPRLSQFINKPASKNFVDEGWANTTGVAKDLLERSALIAEKVKSGDVQIHTALYHLDTGKAEFEK